MMQNTQTLLSRLSSRNKTSHRAGGRDNEIEDVSGRISADVRNTALLIRDDDKRHDEYSQLIAKIDVPQNLVEIDA
ncbi:EscC/YscC/HrcC family type III secretion system outer membrane ring protein, partial [Erwinia amylovora]|nr:EscC/YscC/HrcC family type III secretion system outer membrane ring protein [Erwinia amylovora]